MTDLAGLFIRSAFVENMPLTLFLGLCTFLALSRRPGTAAGLGVAVIVVMGVTVPVNHLLYQFVLAPGAWTWAGLPDLDLSYLRLLTFIGVIAAAVQLVEMVMDRCLPALFNTFGVFLSLLAVHCAILGGSLFMADRRYDLAESTVFGLGSGTGFALAVIMLSAIRRRLAYADLPGGLQGLGIAFIITGMMSLGFSTFAQVALP
ncbi:MULTISPECIES: NADH:ubiquinone reductase (Na(+)-transporting) subunit E [unclassified Devosia]|uniref:NADH:ubiquinone reductase (Na(+)-transporting) subunit E n=1 Tax=unclassified Devosia TaxID=196773 RepID=UPI00145E29F9|nr:MULTISPECIES: NADH:ubiquinone reductase (Na(+)-transporting) subunit E [unclassified Devosia]MBJ6987452.1 NADH:ubiquinone reductase (Na(+)-transporting) subunit E [Devosia sp. MC521]QMW63616.1 NADH:ubiquinone reductase (Na(+)-transporting) subunit E [Devosia sp. MC521]